MNTNKYFIINIFLKYIREHISILTYIYNLKIMKVLKYIFEYYKWN